ESARLLLLSKSRQHPIGIGNSSGHVGHNFCEHVMGPGVTGLAKEMVGTEPTLDDGKPGGFYVPRFRNLQDKQPGFVRGYGFEGGAGFGIFPSNAFDTPGFGGQFKTTVRDQFQQSHDVKNLFVVDGSSHVSASCQNPTWTIMSLAWRSCEHLADEFKRGNL